jgi:hypothetical protein
MPLIALMLLARHELDTLSYYGSQVTPNQITPLPDEEATCRISDRVGATPQTQGSPSPTTQPVNHPAIIQHFDITGTAKDYRRSSHKIVSLKSGQSLKCGLGPGYDTNYFPFEMELGETDVRRLELASMVLRESSLDLGYSSVNTNGAFHNFLRQWEGCLAPEATNIDKPRYFQWSGYEISDFLTADSTTIFAATILPLIYGGVHLTAWNYIFPTSPELLLWKIACFGIVATFPVNQLCTEYFNIGVVFWLTGPFYGFCRLYIVLESFLAFRRVRSVCMLLCLGCRVFLTYRYECHF